ncbi:Trypanosome variant surface glycoprotein C-terminal domain containing protein, putative [Trypanosoma equiperdum]|uniref:Trypanosome variant surface glycoprotein C-terminal domain containing protein, putative n=1 Tax=Trypanosoma equiperdum TaxID=5694 RepID=A0A1G4I2E7_TRYEQ|nr:Trypanosome variant surface glycoprotein C-terminal domain containing protein, putative [Trypanosoma equiperdum]
MLHPHEFLAILSTQTLLSLLANANDEPTINGHVNDFCHERTYGLELRTVLTKRLSTSIQQTEELTLEHQLLSLAAERYRLTPKGPADAALRNLAQQQTMMQAKETKEKQPTLQKAIKVLDTKLAELATFEALTTASPTSNTAATATVADDTTKKHFTGGTVKLCGTSTSVPTTTTKVCDTTKGHHSDVRKAGSIIKTLRTIALRPAKQLTQPTINLVVELQGSPQASNTMSAVAAKPACKDDNAGGSTMDDWQGIAMQTPTLTPTTTFQQIKIAETRTQQGPSGETKAPGELNLLIQDADLAAALDEAKTTEPTIYQKVSERDLNSLAIDGTIQKMAQAMLGATEQGKRLKGEPEKLTKQLCGGEAAKIRENFFDQLKNDKTTIPNGGTKIEGSTKVIAEGSNLATAMAYYYGENMKKGMLTAAGDNPKGDGKTDTGDKPGEKKDGGNKATAADCTGTEETNCDTKKCDWDKEKKDSKVKDGAVIISAVIKAPLLLAFLFFNPSPLNFFLAEIF